MAIFRGLAYILTNGRGDRNLNMSLTTGSGPGGAGHSRRRDRLPRDWPSSCIFMRATDLGRNIYAIGGNPNAAKLVGIDVENTVSASIRSPASSAASRPFC